MRIACLNTVLVLVTLGALSCSNGGTAAPDPEFDASTDVLPEEDATNADAFVDAGPGVDAGDAGTDALVGDVGTDADTDETSDPGCTTNEECVEANPDLSVCQVALCDSISGQCVVDDLKNGAPCDDLNPCTGEDSCLDGACVSGENVCQCKEDADCVEFDDLNLCNGTLVCLENVCVVDDETVIECDTSDDTDCLVTSCAPATGICVQSAATDGAPCDDADGCTLGDVCLAGECTSGIPLNCDDGNACTSDLCDPLAGCTSVPLSDVPCSDGNSCTDNDMCIDGICTGENTCDCIGDEDCAAFDDEDLCNGSLVCLESLCQLDETSVVVCEPSDSPCKAVSCNPLDGLCETKALANGPPCDDGDMCTQGDICMAGECLGEELLCDDDNPCTDDTCEPDAGCLFAPLTDVSCDDFNACTEGDFCLDGACVPGSDNVCDCEADEECTALGDGDLCKGPLVCLDNVCVVKPDSVVMCDTSLDTQCSKNLCDPENGECVLLNLADGTACDDSLLCTQDDACLLGKCSGTIMVCDDANLCTDDVCIEGEGGCKHLANTQPCDDGNACTMDDFCKDSQCGGMVIPCGDGNDCTEDSCDPLTGCINSPIEAECDDADLCTENDGCFEGECGGDAVECDDSEVCTTDLCVAEEGCVYYDNDEPCEDADACTVGDTCAGGECQPGGIMDCDDGNPCTVDSCTLGECVNETLDGVECDDADACTEGDACVQGACLGGAIDCDDGNACTNDTCDPLAGCVNSFNNAPCDDNNVCTDNDSCVQGMCIGGPFVLCDDNNLCTSDGCNPQSGCIHQPLSMVLCNDNDVCTLNDTCVNGVCEGTGQMACDDGNDCTSDSCNALQGCAHEPLTGPVCDDGSLCTMEDACVDGTCTGSPINCADIDPCTLDLCDPNQGCFQAPVPNDPPVSCDDGSPCLLVDTCVNGECVGSDPVECNDGNLCTDDYCDEDTGDCEASNNDAPCDDNNPCTQSDTCGNGFCLGGDWLPCDDNNICTADACVPAGGGCVYTPINAPCDDGNPCTAPDMCQDGTCTPGNTICQCVEDTDCDDDGNLCNGTLTCVDNACILNPDTVIVCDPGNDTECRENLCDPDTGDCDMVFAIDGTQCSDGSLCTDGDQCLNGLCAGVEIACDDHILCTSDSCEPQAGCVFTNNTLPCDDGDVCTVEDTCGGGECAGTPYECEDDNACTDDLCMAVGDLPQCFHQYNTAECDDESACTDNDTCINGVCKGTAIACLDDNFCTDNECDPATGCVFPQNSLPCDDSDPCTVTDQCADGECGGQPKDCGDSNPCTDDSCAADSGACVNQPNTDECDDDTACTEDDICAAGVCAGLPVVCDDGNTCTQNLCDQQDGCFYPELPDNSPCDDSNLCTDGDLCTAGECGGLWQEGCCIEDANCDDDFLCSVDTCTGNACGYTAMDCADDNDCTGDTCLEGECLHLALGEAQTLYEEYFDSGEAAGWQFAINEGGVDEIYWSVDDNRSYSEEYSLYVGNPEDYSYDYGMGDTTAFSPPVFLPDIDGLELSFRYRAFLDDGQCTWDYLKVEVELEGEKVEELTPRICSSNWNFQQRTYSLASYGGHSVRFRLTFRTVDTQFNDDEGIYVDNFMVTGGPDDGCCSFDGDCDDDSNCTTDTCVDSNCEFTPAGGTYFQEDFDSGSIQTGSQWSNTTWHLNTDNNEIAWEVDDTRSVSTSYSLYCGNDEDQSYDHDAATATARTPRFEVPATAAPLLKFRLWTDFEEQGCNDDVFAVFAYHQNTLPAGQLPEFTQCTTTDGFAEVEIDLSDLAGNDIYVLFSFQSDNNDNDGEGVYVDSIRLEDSATGDDCCLTDADCDDGDACSEDVCVGTDNGGICYNFAADGFSEDFDDGAADGWLTYSNSWYVNWHVEDHRAVSKPNSFYCGNAQTHRYTGYGNGNANAYTPWIELANLPGHTPYVSYSRYLHLMPLQNHCARVYLQVQGVWGTTLLAEVCGNQVDDDPQWVDTTHKLAAYAGQTVRLQFQFQFPNSPVGFSQYEGVYMDDFQVLYDGCE